MITASSCGGEYELSDLVGKGLGVDAGAIRQNDDGELIRRKELNQGTKAHGFTSVPHPGVALVGIEEPAEAVGNGLAGCGIVASKLGGPVSFGAVVEFHGSEGDSHFPLAQQGVFLQRLVPLCQVFQVGVDAAVTRCRGGGALIGLETLAVLPRA